MGLISYLVKKSAQKAIIKTIGKTTVEVITAKTNAEADRLNAQTKKINAEIERINAENGIGQAVKKNDTIYIKPPRSSEKYRDMNALLAAKELLAAGFVNITLKPARTLSERSKKYGLIRSISINGNSDFIGVKKISPYSKIIITYSDFKKDVNEGVYANVERITPGTITSVADLAAPVEPQTDVRNGQKDNTTESGCKKYCVYCGEMIAKKEARFCSACGKEL